MSSAPDALGVAARLTAALREEGLPVGTDRSRAFVTGVAVCGDLYWAGRLALLSRPEDLPVYDRVFRAVLTESPLPPPEEPATPEQDRDDGDLDGPEAARGEAEFAEASRAEILRRIPFAQLSAEDVAELARAIGAVRRRPPLQPTRRRRSAPRGTIDLRRTIRDMHRLGGDAALPRFAAPGVRPQPVTFLLDVSGSMRTTTRALLLACAAFVRADRVHEAFTFGTRLTRVAPLLRGPLLEDTLDRVCEAVEDREGGTRIGESVEALLRRHGKSRVVRGAVVVIYSDGLETGDPELLRQQMQRLHRLARRVVWLNPLSASPSYRPLARGMHAALPFVDEFASGHTIASFETVVDATLDDALG
ncbi:MAG: VWA domain-containing protein [Vicinamibacterales bacterium]